VGGDLNDISFSVRRRFDRTGQRGRAIEVMKGEHHPERPGVFPDRLVGQLAERLDLDVAPLAARVASLDQPIELGFNASGEKAASAAAAAGDQKGGAAATVAAQLFVAQPGQETRAFGVAGKPVDAEFDGGGFPGSRADLRGHLDGSRSRGHGTDARQPLSEWTHPGPFALPD